MPLTDAQKMKRFRERRGMSQRAVAAVLGVSQPTISWIETGRTPIDWLLAWNMERLDVVNEAVALDAREHSFIDFPRHTHSMNPQQFALHLPTCKTCLAACISRAPTREGQFEMVGGFVDAS